jgi:CRP-like cAMP-binding protein
LEIRFFGERAILEGKPRAATVICKTDCVFMTIAKKDLDGVILESKVKLKFFREKLIFDGKKKK